MSVRHPPNDTISHNYTSGERLSPRSKNLGITELSSDTKGSQSVGDTGIEPVTSAEYAFDIDFDTLTWRYLGDAETAQMPPTRRKIVTTLTEADGPLGPTEIAKRAGLEVNTVKSSVQPMVTDSVIRAMGDGTYEVHGGS